MSVSSTVLGDLSINRNELSLILTLLALPVFFQNSFFLSGREIPQLTPDRLPLTLCDGSTTDGDVMTIQNMHQFVIPNELTTPWNPSQTKAPDEAAFDCRCAQCARAFPDTSALFQHWYGPDLLLCGIVWDNEVVLT